MWVKFGASLHGSIIRLGLEMDLFTANSLLSMYANAYNVFDEIPDRKSSDRKKRVFERMVERDVVSYNTIILGYVKSGMCDQVMRVVSMGGA